MFLKKHIHHLLSLCLVFSLTSCLSLEKEIQKEVTNTESERMKDFTFTSNAIPFNSLSYISIELDSSDLNEVEIKGSSNKKAALHYLVTKFLKEQL